MTKFTNPTKLCKPQVSASCREETEQQALDTAGKSNLTSMKTGSNMCEIAREGSC